MKIVLINPYGGYSDRSGKEPPLGLMYLASVLENAEHHVKIIDLRLLETYYKKQIEARSLEQLNRLAYRKAFCDLLNEVSTFRPEIIGITAMTQTYPHAKEILRTLRAKYSDSLYLLGGIHSTLAYEEVLHQCPEADLIVLYEGEYTLLDIAEKYEEHLDFDVREVPGIAYKDDNGEAQLTSHRPRIENLDDLPLPARHLLDIKKYGDIGSSVGNMITSRGCPFDCIFCSTSQFHGRKVRAHSPKRVVDEAEELYHKYNQKYISFCDDAFTFDRKRTLTICEDIIRRGLLVNWGCNTRVDLVDQDLLEKMYGAGCRDIFYGVESASEEVLQNMGKKFTLGQIKDALILTKKVGIKVTAAFIIGLPGETSESIKKICGLIAETKPDSLTLSILMPFPGTVIYDTPDKYDLKILHKNWRYYSHTVPVIETSTMSKGELLRAYVEVQEEFFRMKGRALRKVKLPRKKSL